MKLAIVKYETVLDEVNSVSDSKVAKLFSEYGEQIPKQSPFFGAQLRLIPIIERQFSDERFFIAGEGFYTSVEYNQVTKIPHKKLRDTDHIIKEKLNDLGVYSDNMLRQIVSGYSEIERSTWEIQETEAAQLKSDPNAAAPMLRQLAQFRNIPLDTLTDKVLAKSSIYKTTSGKLLGKKQKIEDILEAWDGTAEEAFEFDIHKEWDK